jgi:hypothetical protein
MSASVLIQLFDDRAVVLTCSSPSSYDDSDEEALVVPFTKSPLDNCRGSHPTKHRTYVGDKYAKRAKKNTKGARKV